jgi:hypothetical protein
MTPPERSTAEPRSRKTEDTWVERLRREILFPALRLHAKAAAKRRAGVCYGFRGELGATASGAPNPVLVRAGFGVLGVAKPSDAFVSARRRYAVFSQAAREGRMSAARLRLAAKALFLAWARSRRVAVYLCGTGLTTILHGVAPRRR